MKNILKRLPLALALLAFISTSACDKKAETPAPEPAAVAEAGAAKADPVKAEPAKAEPAGAAKKADPAKAEPAKAEPAAAVDTAAAVAPKVTLMEAGAEPRIALRFAPAKGDVQKLSLTMTMTMGMNMGGQAIPKMTLPPMKMDMSATVKDVNAAGDIAYAFKIDGAEVMPSDNAMPGMAEAMKEGLAGIKGLGGEATITNRGFAKEGSLSLPDDVPPQVRQMVDGFEQSLNQMSTPVPAEAVGVGAKWTVEQTIDQNSMKLTQIATFELVSIEGTAVKTKFSITQKGDRQELELPDLPPGAKAELLSLKGSGTGTTTLNLARVLPSASTGKVSSSVSMAIDAMGQKQNMDMDIDIDMKLTSD